MSEVTQILERVERGDEKAAGELLPLAYREFRKLPPARMRWLPISEPNRRPVE
jgi:hypothetical protein